MSENVYQELVNFVRSILPPHRDAAVKFFDDPDASFGAHGFAGQDLSQYDLSQVVSDACNDPSVPADVRSAAQSYTGSSHPARSYEHTVQQLQQVTTVVYEGDEYFVDNRTSIDVEHLEGDIDIDNITAQGDHAAAAGDDLNQASDGSQIINGDNYGEATVVGDRGVNVDLDGFPTGPRGPLQEVPATDRVLTDPSGRGLPGLNINTGDGFAGAQGSPDAVVGDHNQVANVHGSLSQSNLNFGDGNLNNAGSTQTDSPTAFGGGSAVSQHDNTVDHGGALSGQGPATGQDNDTDNGEHNLVFAIDSNVATEQGDGDQHDHLDQGHGHQPGFIADPVSHTHLLPEAAAAVPGDFQDGGES